MSTILNGRVVQVILAQNTGTSATGTELDISGYLLAMGEIGWSVDENLTKLSLGSLGLTVTDDASETVWSFIQSGLDSASGLLPPWIILIVDGVQKFIGIVKETPERTQDNSTLEISITAVAWSSMLESKRITSDWARDFYRTGASLAAGTSVTAKSAYNKELRRGHDRQLVAVDAAQAGNFSVGDWVYFSNYSSFTDFNKKYPVLEVWTGDVGGLGTMLCLRLGGGFWWKENSGDTANYGQTSSLYRVYTSAANDTDPAFTVAEDFTASSSTSKTSILLNNTGTNLGVGGLQPGDILDKVVNALNDADTSFSITVVDVDPVNNIIYIDSPLSNDLVSGVTTFKLNAKSLAESVLVPISNLIERGLSGLASMDYTCYVPASLPSPCLSFLSPASPTNQNTHTETLSWVSDIQPTLTGFEVQGVVGTAWTGLPGVGWDALATWTKKVNWTSQVSTAPAYVMPYQTVPSGHKSTSRGQTKYPGLRGLDSVDGDDGTTEFSKSLVTAYKYVYDYSGLRCYQFAVTGSAWSVTVQTWNGTAWSTLSGFSTTGMGNPVDVVPFKDAASPVGTAYGLLALYRDGTVKTVLSTVSLSTTLMGSDVLDSTGTLQAVLKQTSNGLYYLTPSGYGTIHIVSGKLVSKWVQIINTSIPTQTVTPLTSTFCYANGRIITLAKVSYKASATDDRTTDDTYLIQLTPTIQATAQNSVISVDKIVANIPRATMAVKSPVSEDIMGFMGGRLFQIATTLPSVVERFNAVNQTAQAVIEFVCAMTNSVASPTVDGRLRLISRGYSSSVVNLTVDLVSSKEGLWNKHLADCVVITGADTTKKGVAVSTTQLSGLTISYSNDVYIRNSSQAQAIAESYLAFFEVPRREVEQVWFSGTVPAPWETLDPMQLVTINGGTTKYYLVGLSHNLETQTATAQLLEVV